MPIPKLLLLLCATFPCLLSAQSAPGWNELLQTADSLYQIDEYNSSETVLTKVIQQLTQANALSSPTAARAYILQGDLFRVQYEFEQASSFYKKAFDIVPASESVTIGKLYNKMGLCAEYTRQYELAEDYYTQALEFLRPALGEKHLEVAKVLQNRGFLASANKNHQEAARFLQQALDIKLDTLGEEHEEVGRLRLNLGTELGRALQYKSAFPQLEQAEQILLDIKGPDDPLMGSVYLNIGIVYLRQGDIGRALDYSEKALDNFKRTRGETHPYVGDALNNIGSCYQQWRQYKRALAYFEQALAIDLQQPELEYYSLGNAYYNIGICRRAEEQYAEAEAAFAKASDYYARSLPPNHPYWIETTIQLGQCACLQDQFAEAETLYKTAQQAYDQRSESQLSELSYLALQQARCFNRQGRLTEALEMLEETLTRLEYEPENLRYEEQLATPEFPRLLYQKGKTLFQQYEHEQQIALLLEASATFQQLSQLYDIMRRSYRAPSSSAFLVEELSEVFGTAIAVEQELYKKTGDAQHLQQGLAFAEKGKSVLLLDNINLLASASVAGVPDDLLDHQSALQASINFWESQQAASDSLQQPTTDTLFQLKKAYTNTLNRLENDYPNYYQLRYGDTQPVDWTSLVDKETALLEYFLSDSSLYVFVVTQQGISVVNPYRPPNLKHTVDSLRRSLTDPHFILGQAEAARRLFVESSHTLYRQLLQDALAKLPENINRLLLIPDGLLGYIPFEVLLQSQPDASVPFGKMPYVLRRYAVQYAYAGHLLLEQRKLQHTKQQQYFAGFAPRYEVDALPVQDSLDNPIAQLVRSGALPLPGARREVETIANLLDGTTFTGTAATKTAFQQQAADFAILHLSMHTLLDDIQPLSSLLLFTPDSLSDGQLTMAELYAMRLSAKLAVLSACNTGYGKIRKGEGIMSLSRAFTYAGVPSTAMSLWKVPDDATSRIMVSFYEHLKAGATKDAALRQAKLDYLDQIVAPEQGHPYYWAGFISVGDAVPLSSSRPLWWLLGLAVVLFVAAFWYWKSMQKV